MAVHRGALSRCCGDREDRSQHSFHTSGVDLPAMTVEPIIPASEVIPVHSVGGGGVQAVLTNYYLVLQTRVPYKLGQSRVGQLG